MSKKSKAPTTVRPFIFHGIDLDWENEEDPMGDCPFCGKAKFAVNVSTGMARCFVCGVSEEGGKGLNAFSFVRELHGLLKDDSESFSESEFDYSSLAEDRGISEETCYDFEIVQDDGDNWLIPAYNADGKLCQLYRYGDTCYPTPQLGAQMFGVNLINRKHKVLNICEGPWDTMALYEAFKKEKVSQSVIGIPGITVFRDVWLRLISDYDQIKIWQDNDHPNNVDGQERGLGGLKGVQLIASSINSMKNPPEVFYCSWGASENLGYNKDYENKCDVRDVLTGKVTL